MADKKISELPDGGALQGTDEVVVARSGGNYSILGSEIGLTPPVTLTGVDPDDVVLTIEAAPGASDVGNSVFRMKDDTGYERWDIDAFGHSEYRNGTGGQVTVDPVGWVYIFGDFSEMASVGIDSLLLVKGSELTDPAQLTVQRPGFGFGVRAQPPSTTDASFQAAAITDQTGPLIEGRDPDYNLVFAVGVDGGITVTLPTSNPGPNILWNDGGTVKVGT